MRVEGKGNAGVALGLLALLSGCSLVSSFDDYEFGPGSGEDGGTDGRDAGEDGGGGGSGGRGSGGSGSGGTGATDSGMQDAGMVDTTLPPDTVGMDCTSDAQCDDDKPCNGEETCGSEDTCEAGTPHDCSGNFCSTCVNDGDTPRCEVSDEREGQTCADNQVTSDAADTCSSEFVCVAGACEPQTVETCSPNGCQQKGGCDGERCVLAPLPATTACDDGSMCTLNDHCSGTDGSCVGDAKDCGDGVGCTDDTCDPANGNCSSTVNDANCSDQCRTGTCDPTLDCQYTSRTDFIGCDDGDANSAPDFCYRGLCAGGVRRTPTASCSVAGCGCSGWGTARDLDYHFSGKYLALVGVAQTGAGTCHTGEVSVVYDVASTQMTPFTSDLPGGGIRQPGRDIHSGYVVADAAIGTLDATALSVDWTTDLGSSLASSTPALIRYGGMSLHGEGVLLGGETHVWVWGADSGTPSTARLARCTWSPCVFQPCTEPVPSCSYGTALATSSYAGLVPFAHRSGSGISGVNVYDGAIAAVTADGPIGRAYEDGTGKDYITGTLRRADSGTTWHGAIWRAPATALFFGDGATNLMVCSDLDQAGDFACNAVTGVPNQASRSYYDAVITAGGGIALLASTCTGTGVCLSYTSYLVVLPPATDELVGSNWIEYELGSYAALGGGGRSPTEVAAGGDSILVLGIESSPSSTSAPYLWAFGPVP
jgi:hypothetical protein